MRSELAKRVLAVERYRHRKDTDVLIFILEDRISATGEQVSVVHNYDPMSHGKQCVDVVLSDGSTWKCIDETKRDESCVVQVGGSQVSNVL